MRNDGASSNQFIWNMIMLEISPTSQWVLIDQQQQQQLDSGDTGDPTEFSPWIVFSCSEKRWCQARFGLPPHSFFSGCHVSSICPLIPGEPQLSEKYHVPEISSGSELHLSPRSVWKSFFYWGQTCESLPCCPLSSCFCSPASFSSLCSNWRCHFLESFGSSSHRNAHH